MSRPEHLSATAAKSTGAHYTPVGLADFLAKETASQVFLRAGSVRILDPACGDGILLKSIVEAFPDAVRSRLALCGFETDSVALKRAKETLGSLAVLSVQLRNDDFIEYVGKQYQLGSPLFHMPRDHEDLYDVVVSNPPYVRTQVIGAEKSQELALIFGLSGRVDLYHAFVVAMSRVLRNGGILGLLTSNRFMFTQSGAVLRKLLRSSFLLRKVFDLGDTKLFSAAVLPVIVIGQKGTRTPSCHECEYVRAYESRNDHALKFEVVSNILEALGNGLIGAVEAPQGRFVIEKGILEEDNKAEDVWRLSSDASRAWLSRITAKQHCTFSEVANIRVGIKTTADAVFIRDDWNSLSKGIRPESELLRPLITHHIAARWRVAADVEIQKKVLYTHVEDDRGGRKAIDLAQWPKAKAYLEAHRNQLESRTYVLKAGRNWFEIWVPQKPADWQKPKVVFPDISEGPRFFLDDSRNAIANGDCYWITLRHGWHADWLLLILAVANSSFISKYYDVVFHNKLYAGRRRFMTQYVAQFPLPDIRTANAKRVVGLVKELVANNADQATESQLDDLIWSSFGVPKESGW